MTATAHPDRHFKYWLIAPAVFLLLAVGLFPLIYSLVVSFMRIDMMDTDTSFAWFYNYKNLFKDGRLWWSLAHTLLITAIDTPSHGTLAIVDGNDADALPGDLAAFAAWWLAEPSLDGGQVAGRIAPRGAAGAQLMVLVDHPEAEDGERLLSGPQGRLLDAILVALGIPADQAYVASVLPRHMPMPDWAGMHEAGLGDITCCHVALAAPQRLLVFGSHISSLLGHDPTKTTEPLRQFAHESASIPALVAPGLATLIARPRGKARLWQQLLDWSS